MMNLNQLAEWLGGQRLEGNDKPTMSSVVATATEDSANGRVKVVLTDDVIGVEDADGNFEGSTEIEIPTSAHVEKGDNVIITLFGGAMSKPLYTQVQGSGDRTYNLATLAQAAAEAAEIVAEEAYDAIEATNEHFFADSNGIHVSTEENDADTGPNLLANSIGILLRDGTLIRTAQTPSGFAVYDGLGNQSGNIIGLLGDVITLGKEGEQQLVLDQDAFELLNSSGEPFFHVGFSDDAIGPGGTPIKSQFILFDDPGSLPSRTIGAHSVALGFGTQATANTSVAFGTLTEANGAASIAAGFNNHADGTVSAAFGQGNVATGSGQLVCGNYCEEDYNQETLFSVGDGLSKTDRRDAFTVKTNGRLSTNHGDVMAAAVLYESTVVDLTTTYIDLTSGLAAADFYSVEQFKKLEIFYYDNLGNKGSVAIWHPKVNDQVLVTTTAANINADAFVVRTRVMKIVDTGHLWHMAGWSAEYAVNTRSQATQLTSGNYIGIQAVIGYY